MTPDRKSLKCITCRRVLSAECFYRDKHRSSGLASRCKSCDHEHTQKRRSDPGVRRRHNNPEKSKVYSAVSAAIRTGALVRPALCEGCSQPAGVARDGRSLLHAHHSDYSKPLTVRWLCHTCHESEHHMESAA